MVPFEHSHNLPKGFRRAWLKISRVPGQIRSVQEFGQQPGGGQENGSTWNHEIVLILVPVVNEKSVHCGSGKVVAGKKAGKEWIKSSLFVKHKA
jgi:hypothetical protein